MSESALEQALLARSQNRVAQAVRMQAEAQAAAEGQIVIRWLGCEFTCNFLESRTMCARFFSFIHKSGLLPQL